MTTVNIIKERGYHRDFVPGSDCCGHLLVQLDLNLLLVTSAHCLSVVLQQFVTVAQVVHL